MESSVATDDAALDSTLENPAAKEDDAAGFETVAAILEISELSEAATLESALDAPAVTEAGTDDDSLA